MCGIAGAFGHPDEEVVREMMAVLGHRGPDDEGTHQARSTDGVLGHTRLAIMDPQGGHQPIVDRNGARAIIANGEIYNFPKLRPQLSERHSFDTDSDTEAILHLYGEHGTDAVDHLDGMYAFAILDEQGLMLARDPVGVKPLYYGRSNGTLLFASELKALAGHCPEVSEFPPGTLYHSGSGFHRFYDVPDIAPERDKSVEQWCQEIRSTMERCVEKRLMSDVPVGAFLSGGLDSSVIAALARRHKQELHTFAVGIEGSGDLEAARRVADHLDTIHHEYVLTADEIADALPAIVFHLESFDQDLVRSAIPTYFTSRMAKGEVQVILTGEGADELFAGYDYHKQVEPREQLQRELRRSVKALHNINLQRVDRMTMAHAVEGRVPFLDREMIALGQRVPPELKLHGDPLEEKWILRKAFEDLLPEEIVWRKKEQFDQGSGTSDVVAEIGARGMSADQASAHRAAYPEARLRSDEEAYYHSLLLEAFEHPEPVLANVGRWSEHGAA
ncbi:MAG: asparagine synthase B [Thermoleophilaceae bacterium]|nr:asparagine synthase B [Thermoleophilaceae bacterium]